MSHVDEGILHAYLDGALDALADAGELPDGATANDVVAHLNACADCSARLEAERAIRDASGMVLRDVGLASIAIPPMPGSAGGSRARRTGWLPLSWAATVLLAVGAGWWASAEWRGASSDMAEASGEAQAASPAATPPPPASDIAADVAAEAPSMRAMEAAPGSDSREAAADLIVSAGQVASSDAEMSVPAPTESRLPDTQITGLRIAASSAEMAGRAPEPIGVAFADTVIRSVDSSSIVVDQPGNTRARAASAGAARALQSAAASPPVLSFDAGTDASKALVSPTRSMFATFDTIIAHDRAGIAQFTPVSAAAAAGVADLVYVVPGGSPPVIETAQAIGVRLARVRQTLPSGVEIELIARREVTIALEALVVTGEVMAQQAPRAERRESEPPPVAAAPVASVAAVRTSSDGLGELLLQDPSGQVWMILRGRLTTAELQVLASRLTNGPAAR